MENSLKYLCIDCISINLELNYFLCKKYGWRVPRIFGDAIFIHSSTIRAPITEEGAKFFRREIVELTDFYSCNGRIQVYSYNFLEGHEFKNLEFRMLNKFILDPSICRVYTRRLLFENISWEFIDRHQLVNLFERKLSISKVVCLKNAPGTKIPKTIFDGIRKSAFQLNELYFDNLTFDSKYIRHFILLLEEAFNLEKLTLKFQQLLINFKDRIFKSLKNCFRTLKSLTVKNMVCTVDDFVILIEGLQRLERLSISQCMYDRESSCRTLFKILMKNKLNFKKFKLTPCYIRKNDEEDINAFIDFYKDTLENLQLGIYTLDESKTAQNLQFGISELMCNLKKFDMTFLGPRDDSNNLSNCYDNCKILEKVRVSPENKFEIAEKCLRNCYKTLKDIKFYDVPSNKLITILKLVEKVECLQKLQLTISHRSYEAVKTLCQIIDKQQANLTHLIISLSYVNPELKLFDIISNCSKLQHLHLSCRVSGGLNRIVISAPKYFKNLQYLSIHFQDLDKDELNRLGDSLRFSYQLRFLFINISGRDIEIYDEFLLKIRHLEVTLEEYHLSANAKSLKYYCQNDKSFLHDLNNNGL